jgi:hypothetical protein
MDGDSICNNYRELRARILDRAVGPLTFCPDYSNKFLTINNVSSIIRSIIIVKCNYNYN